MLDKTKIIKRIDFDAGNRDHRKAVFTFLKSGHWDIHFEVPQGCTNLPDNLMNQVISKYSECEDAAEWEDAAN